VRAQCRADIQNKAVFPPFKTQSLLMVIEFSGHGSKIFGESLGFKAIKS
jgi:hypothetical protein